jgi:hypothetical protein
MYSVRVEFTEKEGIITGIFFYLDMLLRFFYHKSGRKTVIDERFSSKTKGDRVCGSTFPGQEDLCG